MLPALDADKLAALNQIAARHLAANRIGIKVAMVLSPILFGGIGVGLWAVIPAPFGMYVGGSILGAGLLMLLFLLAYDHRTNTKRPYVASVIVGGWTRVTQEYGGEVLGVDVQVQQAARLLPTGYGEMLAERQGRQDKHVVASPNAFNAAPPGAPMLMLCMATGEVIAVDVGGELRSA
jgi:hypothetical protein